MADRTIKFSFVGDTSDLDANVRKTTTTLSSFEEQGLKSAKAVGKGLAAFGIASAAALALTVRGAVKAAESLNVLAKRARGVRALTSEIDTLDKAFGLLTTSGIDSARVLQDLDRNLGKAKGGAVEVQKAFSALNLPKDFASRDAVSRVQLVVRSISKIEDPTERAETAALTLGRSWREMITVFESGDGALDTAIEQVREAGVVSDTAAADAEALVDAMDLLSAAGETLSQDVLTPLIPILTGAADEMRDFLTELDPAQVDAMAKSLSQLVGFVSDVTMGAIKAAAALLGLRASQGNSEAIEAQKAVNKQAEAVEFHRNAVETLTNRLEAYKATNKTTAEGVAQFEEAIADSSTAMTRQLEIFRRLKGEVGESAGLRTFAPTATPGRRTRGGGGGGGGGAGAGPPKEPKKQAEEVEAAVIQMEMSIVKVGTAATRATAAFRAFADEGGNAIMGAAMNIAGAVQGITDAIGGAIAEQMEQTKLDIEGLESDITNATSKGAKDRLMIAKKAKEAELEEHKKAAMAAWVVGHIAAIAQAAINIPLTISQTIAQMGATPLGIGLAVAGGVTAGIALGAVIAEPAPSFHSGGMITGRNIGSDPNAVSISARPGEFVSTPAAVSRLGRDTLEDAERGRAPSRGGSGTRFYYEGRDLDRLHSDRLRAVGSPLSAASSRRAHSRYSSGKVRNG
jgi:hypothetical protein